MFFLNLRKMNLLHFFLPVMFVLGTTYLYSSSLPAVNKIIVIDAGHGGIDPGANRPGVQEKDINLAIALKLKEILHQQGFKVVLSRQSDVELSPECDNEKVRGRYHRDLAARVEMVEESDADLFVSIHANAVSNGSRHGAEVFYAPKSTTGKELAKAIQNELCNVAKVNRTAMPADYFVLRRNKIPAVLVEVGYITNSQERLLLQSSEYQQEVASAIAKGICQFYQ